MKESAIILLLLVTTTLILPASASAECLITGNVSAEVCNNPLGTFCYTLEINWDNDSPYGLSHFCLIVDAEGGTCSCADFSDNISFGLISGSSNGEGGCLVEYSSGLECDGDPSIGMPGIMFKFEPIEETCEPGPTGSGSFVFYSNLPPVPVDEEAISLVDKSAQNYCTGNITGVFPGLACDPVSTSEVHVGALKSIYR